MKKTTLFSIVLIFLLHVINSSAQTTLIKFQKAFGKVQTDIAYSIKSLSNGDYLLAGSSQVMNVAPRQAVFVIKTDSAGNIKWGKVYQSSAANGAFSVEEGVNGYYVFGNAADSATSVSVATLLHIDTNGNLLWDKSYRMYTNEWGAVIKRVNANAYMLCGKTYNTPEDFEIFLLKIDSSGNVLWGKGYNGDVSMTDVANALTQTSDGGFLVTGNSYFIPTHDYYALAIKTDSVGNPAWINAYADTRNTRGAGGYQVPGGYMLGAQMIGAGTAADMLLIRTDTAGNIVWSKTYGGGAGDFAHALVQTDTGFALLGESSSFFSTSVTNGYVVYTDTGGNVVSSYTYGDTMNGSTIMCGVKMPHKGLAMAGYTMGFGLGLEDYYMVKTLGDSSGCYENMVNTTVTPVTISSLSFLNMDTLITVVTDITDSMQTDAVVTGPDQADSVICFSATVIPADTLTTYIIEGGPEALTKIFPNPSDGNFVIEMGKGYGTVLSVNMLNTVGCSMNRQIHYSQAGDRISIAASGLAAENYWIRIVNTAGVISVCKVLIE